MDHVLDDSLLCQSKFFLIGNSDIFDQCVPSIFFPPFHFFFLATSTAHGSVWARDQTFTTAVTQAIATTMTDP